MNKTDNITIEQAKKLLEEDIAKNISEATEEIEGILKKRNLAIAAAPQVAVSQDGTLKIASAIRIVPAQ